MTAAGDEASLAAAAHARWNRRILPDAGLGGIEVMPGMGDARRPDMLANTARTRPRR